MRGWKVGQPINNQTRFGRVPSWKTVRERYWKNQAYLNPENYEVADLKKMKKGRAPQQFNEKLGRMESKELHHNPPQREGGLFEFVEVWPNEHAKLDPRRHTGN